MYDSNCPFSGTDDPQNGPLAHGLSGLGGNFPSTFHTMLGAIFPPKSFSETGPRSSEGIPSVKTWLSFPKK